ncbi:hypothetical protein WUBG_05501 [Wuchereria bancrofti]|uniref:Nucleoporin NUP35 n=1 Tax=Wuchereria bancrofti TaxID=6293 RepID=J9EN64_WUCBA|nr:hypothetical protein WUBG_05501 [Wuchereria bancrofti]VDM08900.1 unnamed protein product [Wuchereria bancrofti]
MIADSEVSLFSDSGRLSSSNTGTFSSQHSAPSFLFGSHSRRRSLIMSFDDSSEKRTMEQDTLTSSSKNSSQTNKSVHWSPALTQTKNISLGGLYEDFHMDTDLDKLSSVGSDVPVDPPLRSMREELLPSNLLPRDLTSSANLSSMLDLQTQQEIAAHWVTVFGFSREDATNVLKLFTRHGTVVAHRFPREGNWMFIRYASPIHAQQALSRNGQIMDGRLRLGVVPVDNEELVNLEDDDYLNIFSQTNSENSNQLSRSGSILSEVSFFCENDPSTITPSCPLDTSFNPSLIASPVRGGIRSLRASFNAVDNYYRVDDEKEPEKSHGFLDKLWSFVS